METNSVNYKMVTLARQSRGLTQSEMAERLGVTQSKLSKIEGGLLSVSGDMLTGFSKLLDYPVSFFMRQDEIYGIGSSLLFHRKRENVPAKTLDCMHAMINIRRIEISRMLLSLNPPPCKVKRLLIDEFDGNVERIAAIVRDAWMLPRGPVDNLTRRIESAGGIIIKCNLGTRQIDAIGHWPPAMPPMIFVNQDIPADRYRFTVAHELGHLVMHDSPNPDMEAQADRFAAEFLMPTEQILPDLYNITLPKLAELKAYWKVAMSSLLRKARDCNRISQNQYKYLTIQMSKMGYRTSEPVILPSEEPTVLDGLTQLHLTSLGYSIDELTRIMDLNKEECTSIYVRPTQPRQGTGHLRLV
ncbi:MAG: ImmA/IrrE family metallo-endopeptidase [Myxococcales bacterium]|nr:ImmA/IrrE family metallo-endopeptidase [Myxococcales bacterium]